MEEYCNPRTENGKPQPAAIVPLATAQAMGFAPPSGQKDKR